MPARCVTNKSEPKAFECPCCGAKYIIATIEVPNGVQHSKFGCVKCDALFPVGEGRVSLEYILLAGDADEKDGDSRNCA
jgi:transcription elongation factor Elf1